MVCFTLSDAILQVIPDCHFEFHTKYHLIQSIDEAYCVLEGGGYEPH